MKIKLIFVGKTKESWCREGEEHYLRRMTPFCDIERIEILEEKITASVSEQEIRKREAEKLFQQIPREFFLVALDPNGNTYSSKKFGEFLKKIRDEKGGKLCFLVGGPLGLHETVLEKADHVISFSRMTFPHDLFRIMLLEQIYRGFSLLAGKKYHK